MLKKLSLITVISVFAYSFVGYHFVFLHLQKEQKEAAKEMILRQLDIRDLSVIPLTAEVKWEEEGHEFFYRGEMYDVVKIANDKGATLLYCINDKKEKALIDHYNLLTTQNSAAGKKIKSHTGDINLFVYTDENPVVDDLGAPAMFGLFDSPLRDNAAAILSPPPKA